MLIYCHIKFTFIVIRMFKEQLKPLQKAYDHRTYGMPPADYQSNNLTQSDLEYQICATLLQHTGKHLSSRETQAMESSRQFLQCFATFRKKQIESSRTLDTMAEESRVMEISVDEEQSIEMARARQPPFSPRRGSQMLGEQLREIQEKCSYTCYAVVNNLVAEFKALEGRLKFHDNREASSSLKQHGGPRLHEQNLILRKKLELQQLRTRQLQEMVDNLKEKNRSISSSLHSQASSAQNTNKYFEINNKVFKDIKAYLQQKESLIKIQGDQLNDVETGLMREIEKVFGADSCPKCCDILRKLKQSIIRFRKYLQNESQQFQKLYDKYKKTMYAIKSRASL